jgi:hypothetical protein
VERFEISSLTGVLTVIVDFLEISSTGALLAVAPFDVPAVSFVAADLAVTIYFIVTPVFLDFSPIPEGFDATVAGLVAGAFEAPVLTVFEPLAPAEGNDFCIADFKSFCN